MDKNRYEAILFDLDGTLIDVRTRLFKLFVELTGCGLSFEEYWEKKATGADQKRMLELIGFSECSAKEFKIKWLRNVERPDLLEEDSLFDDARDFLDSICPNSYKIYLITNRQSYDNLIKELNDLGVKHYFDGIISTFQKCKKAEAVKEHGLMLDNAIFIGDTAEDIEAAKQLGIPGVLVSRNNIEIKSDLSDYFVTDLGELRGILFEE